MKDAAGLLFDPLGTMQSRWRRAGDLYRFRLPLREAYLVAHPDAIRHVLHLRRSVYSRDPLHAAALRQASGSGLTASEGSLWRRQRALLRPAFHPRHEDRVIASALARSESLLARWQGFAADGVAVDLGGEMLQLSLEVIAEALFHVDLDEEEARSLVEEAAAVLDALYRAMRAPIPGASALVFSRRRVRRARQVLYRLADELLARDQAEDRPDDFLALLADGGTERRQVADQIVTMILAGHDTTGAALTWALWLTATHPEAGHRLQAEAGTAFRGFDEGLELERAPYAGAVFKETLRLYPPAWVLSRSPSEGDELGGRPVSAGALVFISPFLTLRHPQFWRRPEAFEPERFMAADDRAHSHPYAYLPFGAGPRMCIGRTIAEVLGPVVLLTVSGSVDLVPLEERRRISLRPRLTLHPTPPPLVTVAPRGSAGGKRDEGLV